MTGEEIKEKILLIILKFYQINEYVDVLKIQISAFSGLSDVEIRQSLNNLEKNKLIEVLDNRAVRNDISGAMYKATNFGDSYLEIKILDGFKEYIKEKDLNNKLKEKSKEDSVILKVTYRDRKVRVNEIVIARPRFESENDLFIQFIINNPNKKLSKQSFEKFKGEKMTKKFEQIIKDLRFKGNIKKLFFPNISIKAVEFRNPVTAEDMFNNGIKDIELADL